MQLLLGSSSLCVTNAATLLADISRTELNGNFIRMLTFSPLFTYQRQCLLKPFLYIEKAIFRNIVTSNNMMNWSL